MTLARTTAVINEAWTPEGRMPKSSSPMCCSWSFRRRCLAISNVVS